MNKVAIAIAAIAALIVTPALAADMAVKAPPPPVAAPAYSWTGFYIGGNGGYAWGSSVQFFTGGGGGGGTTNRYNINGWEGGGTLGYNWQIQQWVLGIETDFSGSHISGSTVSTARYSCGTTCATTVDDFGTLRARLGYGWNNVLLYGTGGLAYGGIASNLDGGTATNWRTGWAAGAGAEYGFAPHWSAKLEWIYLNFSSFQWTNASNGFFSCTGINCSTDAKFSVIRVGVNYRF